MALLIFRSNGKTGPLACLVQIDVGGYGACYLENSSPYPLY